MAGPTNEEGIRMAKGKNAKKETKKPKKKAGVKPNG
jgi:hypothetical protein